MVNGEDVGAEVMFGPGEIRYRPCDKMWYRCDGRSRAGCMMLEGSAEGDRQMQLDEDREALLPAVPDFANWSREFHHASCSILSLLQVHMQVYL